MFEKVKNVAKKAGEKINAFLGKAKLVVGAGLIGLTAFTASALTAFAAVGGIALVIIVIALVGVFFMAVLASVAIFLAGALGLGTGWAVAFFIALVFFIWR